MLTDDNTPPQGSDKSTEDFSTPKTRRPPRKQTFPERWKRMSLPNQLMFLATLVIAAATVVNVIVFTTESISGSRQTDKLVDYAKTQAQAASDISDASSDFTDSAHWMEEHTDDAAIAMQESAGAAESAIAAGRNQFRISIRPWVGIADEADAVKTGPVIFNSQGTGAGVAYRVLLKNFGTQAAQDVIPMASLYITEDIRAVVDSQRQVCSQSLPRGMGFLVFPGKNRISTQTTAMGGISKTDSKTPDGKVQAWLTVCIFYTDQFGCPYRTPVTYNLRDPSTDIGIRFDARPNIAIQGAFREWYSAIAPNKKELKDLKDLGDFYYKRPEPSLGEPCPK